MDEKDYAAWVRNLKNTRFMYRVDVIARVESEDDIAFWQKAIHYLRPSVKVKFIPAEISGSKARQRGKTLCMKLLDYLDKRFIICVDSDFDKFLHPGLLTPSKWILQTHAYSWENHHCQPFNLQNCWQKIDHKYFDFDVFLVSLSRILHPVLIKMLTAKANNIKSWSLDSLCSTILNIQVNQKKILEQNGDLLLKRIAADVDLWQNLQLPIKAEDCIKMEKIATNIGMTQDNAYLYMQGHCIYDLILRIGNFICNREHNFMYEVLSPAFSVCGYDEIEMVKADICQIF